MEINKIFGFSVSTLLIAAGLVFIIIPVWCFFSYVNEYSFGGEYNMTRGAIEDVFYKDDAGNFSSDLVPSLDPAVEKADLPAQVTPELVTKIVTAQAAVDNYFFQARSFPILAIMMVGLFCAIGIMAILLGVSLLLMWRKLDMVLGGKALIKDTNKESKSKSSHERNDKNNWKLTAVLLVVTALVGVEMFVYIKGRLQPFNNGGDGVCDNAVDRICDADCPPAPDFNADPDCANPRTQKPQSNATQEDAVKSYWNEYINKDWGFSIKYPTLISNQDSSNEKLISVAMHEDKLNDKFSFGDNFNGVKIAVKKINGDREFDQFIKEQFGSDCKFIKKEYLYGGSNDENNGTIYDLKIGSNSVEGIPDCAISQSNYKAFYQEKNGNKRIVVLVISDQECSFMAPGVKPDFAVCYDKLVLDNFGFAFGKDF